MDKREHQLLEPLSAVGQKSESFYLLHEKCNLIQMNVINSFN